MKNIQNRIGVTGTSWCKVGELHLKLDRALRITPDMILVTQPHFLQKLRPWAKQNQVKVECVESTNRYAANEELLGRNCDNVAEILVFNQDRYMNHLVQVARSRLPGPHIRQYTSE